MKTEESQSSGIRFMPINSENNETFKRFDRIS